MQASKATEITLLYDGLCPICQKEVAWLKRLNTAEKIAFQDIHALNFNAAQYGLSHQQLMAEIHGLMADGQIIKGMPVFRQLYRSAGLDWLLAATGWPILRPLFDWLYQLFAGNRGKLGKLLRREKSCQRCVK